MRRRCTSRSALALLPFALAVWGCSERQTEPITYGPLYEFLSGQGVQTTTDVAVHSAANNFSSVLANKPPSATATVQESPGTRDFTGDNSIYWKVQFGDGVLGWVSGVFLTPSSGPPGSSFTCNHYVATNGGTGAGTSADPWDLQYAFNGAGNRVLPGDTVCIKGGTYTGNKTVTVSGQQGKLVVFRQDPGGHAILDYPLHGAASPSGLNVQGSYLAFWGFELTNSDQIRSCTCTSGFRADILYNVGSHNRYIALIVHDGGVGLYNEASACDVEITGSIWYNNGYQGSDRGHGHGVYVRSNTGSIKVRDNIAFNQFGYGLHGFNQQTEARKCVLYDGNVAFNNGSLASTSSPNILLGGTDIGGQQDTVRNNMTYFSPAISEVNTNGIAGLQVGYSTTVNVDVRIVNNYAIGGNPALDIHDWQTALVSGNIAYSPAKVLRLNDSPSGYTWTSNTYYRDAAAPAWSYQNNSGTDWQTWKQNATPLGSSDVVNPSAPTTATVFVRPVTVDGQRTGQGNIVVYNWGNATQVPVDLSPVLNSGDAYSIWNAQDPWGVSSSPQTGTYNGGSVNLTITTPPPPTPNGTPSRPPVATGLGFQVFIVRKQ